MEAHAAVFMYGCSGMCGCIADCLSCRREYALMHSPVTTGFELLFNSFKLADCEYHVILSYHVTTIQSFEYEVPSEVCQKVFKIIVSMTLYSILMAKLPLSEIAMNEKNASGRFSNTTSHVIF